MTSGSRLRNQLVQDPRLAETLAWSSSVEVPAYGIVQLKTHASGLFTIQKPDGESGLYYANGPGIVPASGYGSSLAWVRAQPVLFDSAADEADAVVGATCGPIEDEWFMGLDGSGWKIFVPPDDDDIAFVVKEGGSGTGGLGAFGTITDADCTYKTLTVEVTHINNGFGEPVPGTTYGSEIEVDVTDEVWELMKFVIQNGDDDEAVGAKVWIVYMRPISSPDFEWHLVMINGVNVCG